MSNDTQSNPFPGLRPFEREQYKLFFGREGQSEEILNRLEDHRFLAVVGSSGSGKSSLIRAGLIPYLYGGFIPGATSHWRVALLRPEHDPIGNLVNSLNKPEVLGKKSDDPKERKRDAMMLEATLRRSGLGLIEAVQLARLPKDQQILVVVDQFEELFRFATAAGGTHHYEDAAAFVKLLLEASGQSDVPIYVVLTMRSDFIGDCAQFRDLAEQVTTGLYLIPRMSRDQRRRAIVEPVRVADGKIAPRLVTRLLNDVGETDDQLPILQHVLMRTWDHWQSAKPNRPMDLEDYEKVGEWAEALSLHADEAFAGLPDNRHRDVAKRVFQALTERGTDNRETRRPTRLENLANVTGETGDAIKLVVEEFRKPRHSFLMPPTTAVLEPSTIIDISHESLIRRWRRLRDWVDEEAQSAKDYRHVAETAARRALRGNEKSGLWDETALADALKWRDKQRPTLEWAKRYDESGDPRFDTAMDFLEKSRVASEARKAEQAAEIARRERLKRRIFVGSIAASVVLCVLSAVSIWQWRAATKSEQAASRARIQAEASEKAAVSAKEEAVDARGRAEKSETAALETQSHFLADLANQSTRAGDAGTAAMLALEALPDANDPHSRGRSDPPDAKKALSYALQRLQEGVILNGHTDSVSSVMFNPIDSKILVTTGWDTTVLLWDLSGKKPTSRLLGKHDDPVRSVDFSPDGKSVLTASHDKTARIWDAAGQKEIRRFVGHTDWVQSAVFSPGTGKYVLTGSRDRTARLWDAETEKLLGKIGHKEPVQYASFSPEGNIIVTAAGKDVFLWDVAKVLEAGAQDNGNPEAGAPPISLPRGHDSPVLMVLFSRDGKKIVTASFDKTAKVWDVSDPSKPVQTASFEGHDDLVLSATFSPDAKKVLTASIDETARLWDVTEQRVIRLFKGHDDGVWNAVFSPDGQTIATTSFDNTVRLWNVSSKSESGTLDGHKGDIWFAAFSPDEKRIATASFDKTVRLWDPVTQREIWKTPEYGDWVRTVTFSPDSRTLVTTSDKEAILWDVEKQKRIGELKGHTSIVSNAVFRPTDGKIILTSSFDKTARLWDAETLKEISKIEGHGDFLMSAAFSPDGKMVVTASRDKTAKLWDVSNPEKPVYIGVLAGHEKWVMDASFTSDGKMIATASWDKTVRLWDVGTQKQRALLVGGAPARTVRFSPDNHMIITTSDSTARLWDVSDLSAPSELQVLKGHKSIVRSATFSPNGHTVVTASSDTTVRLWPVDPKSQEIPTQTLVDKAKQEVPRCLTIFQRKDAFLELKPPAWCIEMEKWPYDTKDWKQWLEYERAKQSPPLPGSVEWGPWLSARATGSTTTTSNPK